MKKQFVTTILFLVVSVILFMHEESFSSYQEIGLEKETAVVTQNITSLYTELEEAAKTYNEAPMNAVVDKVWKAIPGYSGRVVDMKASYEKMAEKGVFDEKKIVFKNIQPEVQLKDLPPAPIYRGNPNKPMASFAVNVSWGEEHLPAILQTLRKENVRATFFLEGRWVQKHPKLAKMIMEEGHEVGSHAYSHPDLNQSSREKIKEELSKTNEVLEAVLSVQPTLFAPPSGSYNNDVVKIARQMDMYTILWTVDTIDWKNPEPHHMAARVAAEVENGSIILMHPTAATKIGLTDMIHQIKEKGIHINTVGHLLDETRIPEVDS
ncbi:polysaccharide deacetylase family protein [Aliibacillus thermotolerans]|uniref:Polysaccharide deacetylase family protein n=1 Tax=Aliibacillus thermotolerans TaxID=1834418 RepID=A0ABW0U405_9BACI|nr:polysaccharide deacetylase family protein [Aliibacillus thermotolerans]MDA3130566.1 polysaccharide deacetylase family protein [Aliibacillus thermotolerans]